MAQARRVVVLALAPVLALARAPDSAARVQGPAVLRLRLKLAALSARPPAAPAADTSNTQR